MPGPAPKAMGTRAGHSGNKQAFRIMTVSEIPQPELPAFFKWFDGEKMRRIKYPHETVTWWSHWTNSPLNEGFSEHDWDYLLEVSIIHAKFWLGIDFNKNAAELRQRMSKFGVTPEDRAKLRIVTVVADTQEAKEAARLALELNRKMGVDVPTTRRLTSIAGFGSEETA